MKRALALLMLAPLVLATPPHCCACGMRGLFQKENVVLGALLVGAIVYGLLTLNPAILAASVVTAMALVAMSFACVRWEIKLGLALLLFLLFLYL